MRITRPDRGLRMRPLLHAARQHEHEHLQSGRLGVLRTDSQGGRAGVKRHVPVQLFARLL